MRSHKYAFPWGQPQGVEQVVHLSAEKPASWGRDCTRDTLYKRRLAREVWVSAGLTYCCQAEKRYPTVGWADGQAVISFLAILADAPDTDILAGPNVCIMELPPPPPCQAAFGLPAPQGRVSEGCHLGQAPGLAGAAGAGPRSTHQFENCFFIAQQKTRKNKFVRKTLKHQQLSHDLSLKRSVHVFRACLTAETTLWIRKVPISSTH